MKMRCQCAVACLLAACAGAFKSSSHVQPADELRKIDVVVVAHHDDAPIFLGHSLPSIFKWVQRLRNVYVVGTTQMIDLLEVESKKTGSRWPAERVIKVPERLFPFSLQDVVEVRTKARLPRQHVPGDKDRHAWTYQQLLKLYAHMVLGQAGPNRPQLLPSALIADSDDVWLKPVDFVYGEGDEGRHIAWYSLGSKLSGSFDSDTQVGAQCAEELKFDQGLKLRKVVPDGGHLNDAFTGITHHSVFQSDVIADLIDSISLANNKPAWHVLAEVKHPLTEYELYLFWAATKYPERLALRGLPYINSGKANLKQLTHENEKVSLLELSKSSESFVDLVLGSHNSKNQSAQPFVYATFHDDYKSDDSCCVNIDPDEWVGANGKTCTGCFKAEHSVRKQAAQAFSECQRSIYPPLEVGEQVKWKFSDGAERLLDFAACIRGDTTDTDYESLLKQSGTALANLVHA
eukprot:TRINITY_DN63213_c0_g1_i1.p1 TRINITY_DN63213_c0_g1~~TRINITY_DN63213_c0_g1_i1.p1  ORF type:complete len:461 (-),score=84.40 TRINITY_DN63213_c0_g1_i1:235-1617(-)